MIQRVAAFFLVALVMVGCTTTQPPMKEYTITLKPAKSFAKGSCKKYDLKVSQVFVGSSLMSKSMKYRVGEYAEYAYNRSQWSEDPNKALTQAIVANLQETGIFKSVSDYRSFSKSDYTLESRVDRFVQGYSSDEKHSFAAVDLTFQLIENATARVVATKHITKEERLSVVGAAAGVAGLNRLFSEALSEMDQWIDGSCK